jgi:hypothetical protein
MGKALFALAAVLACRPAFGYEVLAPAAATVEVPALPASIVLSAQMSADAVALNRPFKTMDWKPGLDIGGMGDRDASRIHAVQAGPAGKAMLVQGGRARPIAEGENLIYVMFADGTMEAGTRHPPEVDFDREIGVKHMQIADGREVVFAGELERRDGKLRIDLNSGGYSRYGLDRRWAYTPQNRALLKKYAEKVMGERVSVPRANPQ